MIVVSLPILLAASCPKAPPTNRPSPLLNSLALSASSDSALAIPASLDHAPSDPAHSDASETVAERTHYFTTAKNLLLTGSNAVERLMSSYKDIVELAGHTARVANMFTVLEEASRGVYHKTVVEKNGEWRLFIFEALRMFEIPVCMYAREKNECLSELIG